jgi:hypothetical protein|tara:strand:- start:13019 stop:13192 length:174 start_codon:yes stop_codon:yes gene_type:complete
MSELDFALMKWERVRKARLKEDKSLTVVERYLEGCRRNMQELGIWEAAYPTLSPEKP